jgi:hypothetical protein
MTKHVIHISEKEAADTSVATLLEHVRSGAEVVIEDGTRLFAVLPSEVPTRRTIAECIALAKVHEQQTGKAPVLDAAFAEDVEDILRHRKPWNPPTWE